MTTEKAFTVDTLAERWSCSRDVVYDLLRTRELKAFNVGSSWRISPKEVHRFENQ